MERVEEIVAENGLGNEALIEGYDFIEVVVIIDFEVVQTLPAFDVPIGGTVGHSRNLDAGAEVSRSNVVFVALIALEEVVGLVFDAAFNRQRNGLTPSFVKVITVCALIAHYFAPIDLAVLNQVGGGNGDTGFIGHVVAGLADSARAL